ncbi:hypothetical protein NSP_15810 [Nodularia spumigena CCY9414]|nr:hypothetical protein NSP_15810 [Nodularia spumigena CCY9414]
MDVFFVNASVRQYDILFCQKLPVRYFLPNLHSGNDLV